MAITGKQAIACEWAFFGLAAFFVCFRLYVRVFVTLNTSFSDTVIVFVLVCFLSTVICDTISASKGLFAENLTYDSDLIAAFQASGGMSLDDLVTVLQILYASSFPYVCELWGLKVCFLMLYGGLIPRSMRWLRNCLYGTWFVVAVGFIVSMLLMGLWCMPVRRNWDVTKLVGDQGRCFAYSSYEPYFTLTAFHIITDIMIYTLPFPVMRTLSLDRRQHWGVISIFALGGVCIASTIGRTIAIGLVSNIPLVGFWTSFEQMTGLIVVCIPALKVLILEHRSRDGSRAKVDLTDGGSRLSRLQRASVTGIRNEGSGLDEDMEIRWIRMESPVDREGFSTEASATSLSMRGDTSRKKRIDDQESPTPASNEIHAENSFDEHLENLGSSTTRRIVLRKDSLASNEAKTGGV
ncbi:hypothetical protein H072_1079 [Dactylellina haptotyla CBS 200.50]|uniref:Rhodopsin domain-containing protein n=1 Tax=Dactylellina haptotyla (strain CBS 200.50) TaxID=1284197 RepID=S8BZQ3_DACHA|nr:hypothetical protein H072_1079 [Dactylellina haptotyla CBS 200.50]